MEVSKIMESGQATIPKNIREFLKVKCGDKIAFEIANDYVRIKKMHSYDNKNLQFLDSVFIDWNDSGDSAYDCI